MTSGATMKEIAENPLNIPLEFWMWCYDNYEELMAEFQTHGRFLSLRELEDLEEK